MKIKTFRDSIVWEKAHELVLSIYGETKKFPSDEKFGLVNQIRRAASSVCANIAERYTRSRREFVHFLSIARGSLEETKYFIILSNDLDYINEETFSDLYSKAEEIGKMLFGLKTKLK